MQVWDSLKWFTFVMSEEKGFLYKVDKIYKRADGFFNLLQSHFKFGRISLFQYMCLLVFLGVLES